MSVENKIRILETASGCILLAILIVLVSISAIDALDRSIYPGCKVIDQQADVLIIELDPEFSEPTDMNCQKFGELVYQIARDGYQIQVASGHFASLGIITKEMARVLAKGY
jgi:hypothetical protein